MLFLLQFPFSDAKKFINAEGKLNSPQWPFPVADREFVRHFGLVRRRKKGGISGWIDENAYCEADRALRFRTNLSLHKSLQLRCAFRRLFFDGNAVGRYEIGISTKNNAPINLSKQETKLFINHCLQLKVKVKDPSSNSDYYCSLANAGTPISKLYNDATTTTGVSSEKWWVTCGSPIVFFQLNQGEKNYLPYGSYLVYKNIEHKLYLYYSLVPFEGIYVKTWALRIGTDSKEAKILGRNLRASLLRLHAEHECLRIILGHIISGRLKVLAKTPESDHLQYYLNTATKNIGSLEKQASKFDTKAKDIARESLNIIDQGQQEALLNALESIRPNILKKVESYISETPQLTVIHMNTNDTYNVKQAGAVGPQSHAHDITFNQGFTPNEDDMDMEALARELAVLRSALKAEATKPEQDAMIGAVAIAEVAANEGDRSKVLDALAKTGNWVLDVATKIGINVATTMIKQALNIT